MSYEFEEGYKIRDQAATHFLTFPIMGWIDISSRQRYRDIIPESFKFCINDFLIMENIGRAKNQTHSFNSINLFLPLSPLYIGNIIDDENLYDQQLQLSSILETSDLYEEAIQMLNRSSLAHSEWNIENWEPYMIETAMKIAQKWKK